MYYTTRWCISRMRTALISRAFVCRGLPVVARPFTSSFKRLATSMTYSAFDFEVTGKVRWPSSVLCLSGSKIDQGPCSEVLILLQVQGVFFRASTIEKAKKLSLVGHVENTSRGTVTGEVQGEKQPVSQMKVSSPLSTAAGFCC